MLNIRDTISNLAEQVSDGTLDPGSPSHRQMIFEIIRADPSNATYVLEWFAGLKKCGWNFSDDDGRKTAMRLFLYEVKHVSGDLLEFIEVIHGLSGNVDLRNESHVRLALAIVKAGGSKAIGMAPAFIRAAEKDGKNFRDATAAAVVFLNYLRGIEKASGQDLIRQVNRMGQQGLRLADPGSRAILMHLARVFGRDAEDAFTILNNMCFVGFSITRLPIAEPNFFTTLPDFAHFLENFATAMGPVSKRLAPLTSMDPAAMRHPADQTVLLEIAAVALAQWKTDRALPPSTLRPQGTIFEYLPDQHLSPNDGIDVSSPSGSPSFQIPGSKPRFSLFGVLPWRARSPVCIGGSMFR